jgi:hypothetical protein
VLFLEEQAFIYSRRDLVLYSLSSACSRKKIPSVIVVTSTGLDYSSSFVASGGMVSRIQFGRCSSGPFSHLIEAESEKSKLDPEM